MDKNTLCSGCLCAGRRMVAIEEFWERQTFIQIVNEIPMPLPAEDFRLCWECTAMLSRFTRFKNQIKQCYKLLNDYVALNLSTTELQISPRLAVQKEIEISINTNTALEYTEENVKIEDEDEEVDETPIKEEDNVSTYSDIIEDDIPLVENDIPLVENDTPSKVKTKKKKVGKEKKKRRKKDENVELIKEIKLSAEELAEERRMLASREEYVNAMFRCERCIISFPNADDLNDHISIKHDKNKSNFKCNICECTFTREVSSNYHSNKHTRRYECLVCGERLRSVAAATRHYQSTHCHSSEPEPNTEVINKNIEANETQESNESVKQESFPCEFCDKTFKWKTSLRKHVETHRIETGQKRRPYCEPCRLSFTTTSNLQKHVKASLKHQIQLKLWKLKESLPTDSTPPEKQQAHIEKIKGAVNSSRPRFSCAQCGKTFQWRGNLSRHMHSHAVRAKGELVCEPCNRTFSSIATYKQHMKISKKHVSENDFKYMCSDCGKRFANKTRLKDHVNWEHLKNFVHTCDVCQKVFKSHTALYIHKQVHNKDSTDHLCDHCGKHFANLARLRCHIVALHTSTAPYKCSVCCAKFSWHSCLSRHARRVHRRPPRDTTVAPT
ncbi:zinc finger protein 91-like [Ostrinia nubilalis]|uniref:zinc finger protein 91-like n=1 Tax=Ostrinia nubilalis TaxID=29057 RepID=UPI0030822653